MILSSRVPINRFTIFAAALLVLIWTYKLSGTHSTVSGWMRNGGEKWTPVKVPIAEDATTKAVTTTAAAVGGKESGLGLGVMDDDEAAEKDPDAAGGDKEKGGVVVPVEKPKTGGDAEKKDIKATVVMGRIEKDDTDWVQAHLPDWRHAIYAVDQPDSERYLHTPKNKGKESMAYLTYLIDHYDNLTDVQVFVHSHGDGYPRAWHNEPPSVNFNAGKMLQLLRLPTVLKTGYLNLRCNPEPGCPGSLYPSDPTRWGDEKIEEGFVDLWKSLYGNDTAVPEIVGVACCAQFAVSRERVHERPRVFYEKARSWLLETQLGDEPAGKAFEYFWHLMFGMEAVHCAPNYSQCICDTYGCGGRGRVKGRAVDGFRGFV